MLRALGKTDDASTRKILLGPVKARPKAPAIVDPQAATFWNSVSPPESGPMAYSTCRRIANAQTEARYDCWRKIQVYGGLRPGFMTGMGATGYGVSSNQIALPANRMKLNATAPCIDTAVTTVASGDIKPMFLPNNADWGVQQRAKRANKFVDGVFYRNDFRELGPEILTDAAIMPHGIAYGFARNDEILWRRVMKPDVFVDYTDGVNGHPSMYFMRMIVRKDELLAEYPEHAQAIEAARIDWWDGEEASVMDLGVVDCCTIVHAWKLPVNPKVPGRHVVALSGATLECEEWANDWVPLNFLAWSKAKAGFEAQPLMDRLLPIQRRINDKMEILTKVQAGASPKLLLKIGSQIPKQHVQQGANPLDVWEWAGEVPPSYLICEGVSPQFYEDIANDVRMMQMESGISAAATQGEKAPDVESRPAIQTADHLGTKRLAMPTKAYETWTIRAADLTCEIARQEWKKSRTILVQSPGLRGYTSITNEDVAALDRRDALIQCFPINALPSDPAGRLDMLATYLQAGMINPVMAKRLFGFPDIESEMSLENAPVELILWAIDKILDGGDWHKVSPEPDWPMQMGIDLGKLSKQKAKVAGAPQKVLDQLEAWLEVVGYWLAQAQPPMPAPGLPAGPPTSKGLPQPTSPLLPQQGIQPPPMPGAQPGMAA